MKRERVYYSIPFAGPNENYVIKMPYKLRVALTIPIIIGVVLIMFSLIGKVIC